MDSSLIATSHPGGRPSTDNGCPLEKERIKNHLDNLRSLQFTWVDILKEMDVSKSWLRLWKLNNNYTDPFAKTIIRDDDLDVHTS
jgi:hypothetical protein